MKQKHAQEVPLEIHSLDVGQGDATLIIGPEGETTLVDVGADSDKQNIRENIDRRFAARDDVNGLDNVVITHFDQDHAERVSEIAEDYNVDGVYVPNPGTYDPGQSPTDTSTMENEALSDLDVDSTTATCMYSVDTEGTQRAVGRQGRSDTAANQGFDIFTDSDVEVSVLNPAPTEQSHGINRNSGSLAFGVEYGESTAVIASDASELAAADRLNGKQVDYATGFEHGSNTSLTTLKQLDPEHVNFSCDPDDWNHPDTEMTNAAADRGANVTATNEHGTVSFLSDGESGEVLTQRGEPIDGSQTTGTEIQDEIVDSTSNPAPGFADGIAEEDDPLSHTESTPERSEMDLITEEGEELEPEVFIEEDLVPDNTEDIEMFPERGEALDVNELESAAFATYDEETGSFETPSPESLTEINGVGQDLAANLRANGIDIDSTPSSEEIAETDGFREKLSNRVCKKLEQRNGHRDDQDKAGDLMKQLRKKQRDDQDSRADDSLDDGDTDAGTRYEENDRDSGEPDEGDDPEGPGVEL